MEKMFYLFFLMIACQHFWIYEAHKGETSLSLDNDGEISDRNTTIRVKVCPGIWKHILKIIDEHVTWLEGIQLCKDLGYYTIDIALPQWARRNQVRKYLEDISYENLNYTFWTGIFRSYNNSKTWFYGFDNCNEFLGTEQINVDSNDDGQCILIHRNESSKYKETARNDDCTKRNSIVCSKSISEASFLVYPGFDIFNITTDVLSTTNDNSSLETCNETCFNTPSCTAFTYNNFSETCTMFEMTASNERYLYYNITESSKNVTHYAKSGCQLEFTTSVNVSTTLSSDVAVPECQDTLEEDVCLCEKSFSELTGTEIEESVREIIRNLTVDHKSTASRWRKLNSAADNRPASQAVGSLGIIIMAVMCSIPVLVDCLVPPNRLKRG